MLGTAACVRALALSLALPSLVYAGLIPDLHDHAHDHASRTIAHRAPGQDWYHPPHHPVHRLFRRDDNSTGDYPALGSPAWSAPYPTTTPDSSKLPQEWVDALNQAVQAGKIPNIPVSTQTNGGNPTYPNGYDPNGPTVCSATYKCRNPDDIWDAPEGMVGSGFDDGPTEFSPTLYTFLKNNSVKATHFMIGINILWNPAAFEQAYVDNGDDIAVHTYTHPYMTTLSNLDVLAQLGWTMQIIHNSTAGKVPRYWRPPYGDMDERVRAIALEVFGLTAIIWNQDTEDWSLTENGGTTMQAVAQNMQKWLTGAKTPGLIILEHELSAESVQAYMDAYPVMMQNGWQLKSVAEFGDDDAMRDGDLLDLFDTTSSAAPSSTSASSTSASATHSGTTSSSGPVATGGVGTSQQSSATLQWSSRSAWAASALVGAAGLFVHLA
eukprot:PLAT8471.1.p1 GENE.PLAT8471.1~~PLAT8471.1.p1  ORF type:complete len:451 (+),score=-11.89 PLAT8471.1:43-1353(+)